MVSAHRISTEIQNHLYCSLSLIILYFIASVYSTERCCQQYRCNIDSPPGGKYTCQQQHHMNKCNEHWMKGYCCQSCPSSCRQSKCNTANNTEYLAIDKATNNFIFHGDYIFLNGANQPWFDYGKDFGGRRKPSVEKHLTNTIEQIKAAGGNVVRIWIFCEGKHYPIFGKNGNVIQSDPTHTLIKDIVSYLDIAEQNDIFVILTLWNAAMDVKGNGLYGLLTDDNGDKLQSFIDVVLTPLIEATKEYISLAAWDIINEPEGSLLPQTGATQCTDTLYLKFEDIPWTNTRLSVVKYQRFINIVSAAIKAADPESLVTVGSWSEKSSTDRFKYKNLWSDSCLIAAGGHPEGILDFYEIHTYQMNGFYDKYAPLGQKLNSVRFYDLNKPVIIGEFGIEKGGGQWEKLKKEYYAEKKYREIYRKGFNGALMWSMAEEKRVKGSDGDKVCIAGMRELRNMSDVDVDMSNVDNGSVWSRLWSRLWKVLAVLFTGLLLFGKSCMVFVGCLCFRTCVKCCKKSESVEEDEGVYDLVNEERSHWRDNCDEWFMKGVWVFIGIVFALGVVVVFVCVVVMLIEIQHGGQLDDLIG